MSWEFIVILLVVLLYLTGHLMLPGVGSLLNILLVVVILVCIIALVKGIRRMP